VKYIIAHPLVVTSGFFLIDGWHCFSTWLQSGSRPCSARLQNRQNTELTAANCSIAKHQEDVTVLGHRKPRPFCYKPGCDMAEDSQWHRAIAENTGRTGPWAVHCLLWAEYKLGRQWLFSTGADKPCDLWGNVGFGEACLTKEMHHPQTRKRDPWGVLTN